MAGSYYVVITTYEIWEKYRAEYLEAMEAVRDNGLSLGAIKYYLLEDDDVPNKFTEMMVFDSWSHYTLVTKKDLSEDMRAIFERIDTWTIGGPSAVEQKGYQVRMGDFPSMSLNISV